MRSGRWLAGDGITTPPQNQRAPHARPRLTGLIACEGLGHGLVLTGPCPCSPETSRLRSVRDKSVRVFVCLYDTQRGDQSIL